MILSTKVVLPWSTWAIMAMFFVLDIKCLFIDYLAPLSARKDTPIFNQVGN
jgi:hypothetical protein